MAAPRELRHIILPANAIAERYRPHGMKMNVSAPPPPPDRVLHGKKLSRELKGAVDEAKKRRSTAGIALPIPPRGIYVQFESRPGIPLDVSALEDRKQGIEVVAVTNSQTDSPRIEYANVFVPDGKVRHFITRFERYAQPTPKKKGERRHEAMLDPVAKLRLATLRGLWTDDPGVYPREDEEIWWEVWLRRQDDCEIDQLLLFAERQRLVVSKRRLQFTDRTVMLVRATPNQLAASVDVLGVVAEVRRAKESAAFFVDELTSPEQAEWGADLLARMTLAGADAPAVCVLDTGVTRGHTLLASSLDANDCHTCEPSWGSHDHHGHGTEMAGLALLGDLTALLAAHAPLRVQHRLESVKLLPPDGQNLPELYGSVTATATSLAEIAAPARWRCYSMAVATKDTRDRGQPTSWSAAVDALAAGRSFDSTSQGLVYLDGGEDPAYRLFVVCAGNVDNNKIQADHLDISDIEAIHDPAQAWNALTVGAYTEKAVITDTRWDRWKPLAIAGELSPWSTTGVLFDRDWPIKPEVVFEGGNVVVNADGDLDFGCPDVNLLTTHFRPSMKSFVLTNATSAASALASRMAATIAADYPGLWPETVRGLIVHSARWTPRMQSHLALAHGKHRRGQVVQRYGFGVPQLDIALYSARDALTMISQDTIHPFADGKLRDIKFFELPWPADVLAELGAVKVRLRVTLSYFVEPNPGRRGWRKRHRYASHGLRFEVRGPTESLSEFRKRLNKRALEDDESKPMTGGDSSEWYLGTIRNRGSIHSDVLECTAADLAQRGAIAVYPVSGWWKEQPKRDRSEHGVRYALIVSIESPRIDIDLWTPVAQQVGVAVPVVV